MTVQRFGHAVGHVKCGIKSCGIMWKHAGASALTADICPMRKCGQLTVPRMIGFGCNGKPVWCLEGLGGPRFASQHFASLPASSFYRRGSRTAMLPALLPPAVWDAWHDLEIWAHKWWVEFRRACR